MKTYSLLYLK